MTSPWSTKNNGLAEINLLRYMVGMVPAQCRAARAWLGWTQQDLADRARVGVSTVRDFEAERRPRGPMHNNLAAMRAAFERNGMAFQFRENGEPLGIAIAHDAKGESQLPPL